MPKHFGMSGRQFLRDKPLGSIHRLFLVLVHRHEQVGSHIKNVQTPPRTRKAFLEKGHGVFYEARRARIVEHDTVGILPGEPEHRRSRRAHIDVQLSAQFEIKAATWPSDAEFAPVILNKLAAQDSFEISIDSLTTCAVSLPLSACFLSAFKTLPIPRSTLAGANSPSEAASMANSAGCLVWGLKMPRPIFILFVAVAINVALTSALLEWYPSDSQKLWKPRASASFWRVPESRSSRSRRRYQHLNSRSSSPPSLIRCQ